MPLSSKSTSPTTSRRRKKSREKEKKTLKRAIFTYLTFTLTAVYSVNSSRRKRIALKKRNRNYAQYNKMRLREKNTAKILMSFYFLTSKSKEIKTHKRIKNNPKARHQQRFKTIIS